MARKVENPMLKTTSIETVVPLKDQFTNLPYQDKIPMAKLLNRALWLYLNDQEFKEKIKSCTSVIPYHKIF
jgi:predicted amidophosphoribosyltransferase